MMLNGMQSCCGKVPQRWILGLMCFLGICAAFAMRACLSIAITEMVEKPADSIMADDKSCPALKNDDFSGFEHKETENNLTNLDRGSKELYNWDEYTQGIILSSFYWGYVITHLPGGLIAEKYGGKHTLGIGILWTAIFTLLTPAAVKWGDSTALVALRIGMGFGEGITFPAVNVLLAQWTPPDERSRTGAFVYSGSMIGTVFATTVSGVILKYHSWQLVFYVMGIISILWYLVWLITCFNSPKDHPYISSKENSFLQKCMSEHTHDAPPPVPWSHVLMSKPLAAVILALIGFNWSILALITDLPKYMSGVLKFPVEINGYLSSMVYMCMWTGCVITSWIADWVVTRNENWRTRVRKVGSVVALCVSPVFMLGASYAGCDRTAVITMFIFAFTLLGAAYASVMINALDLSPNYAGVLMAFTNGISAFAGIFSPYVIGILTPHQSLMEWRTVFQIMLAVSVITDIVFLLFGSGEVQYWNDPEKNIQQKKGDVEKQSTQK